MATCPIPELTNNPTCFTGEVLSAVERVFYADYDTILNERLLAVPTIAAADNVITEFAPTTPILRELHAGLRFDIAPNGASIRTPDGKDKFAHSITIQNISADPAAELELSKMASSRLVFIVELAGLKIENKINAFKMFGFESGLRVSDGGLVLNSNENGGAAIVNFASDTENSEYESYVRWALKPTITTTYPTMLAAIEAEVIV